MSPRAKLTPTAQAILRWIERKGGRVEFVALCDEWARRNRDPEDMDDALAELMFRDRLYYPEIGVLAVV